MDLGLSLAFVSALANGGKPALKEAAQRGMKSKFIHPKHVPAFDFLFDYAAKYGDVPAPHVITSKTDIALMADPGGTASFFLDTVLDVHLYERLDELFLRGREVLQSTQSTKDAKAFIVQTLQEIAADQLGGVKTKSLIEYGESYLQFYADRKAGIMGIPFPWESINNACQGMFPQQMFLYVARLKVGKTFAMIHSAQTAWKAGHRVLIVTIEMSPEEMAQRFFHMELKVTPRLYQQAKLDSFKEEKLKQQVMDMMSHDDQRIRIVGGEFDLSLNQVSEAIDEAMPELVVIDGAYLLKPEGPQDAKRTESVAKVFNELKLIGVRKKVPLLISTQFNREVKRNSKDTAQAENIGLTDVAGQNATGVFGLFQSEEMKAMNRMLFKNLALRNGHLNDFETNWDIDNMNFTELPKPEEGFGGGHGGGGGSLMPAYDPSAHQKKDGEMF